MSRVREWLAEAFRILGEAARMDRVQAACLLTLLLVVLHGGGAWYFNVPLTVLTGFGLLVPRLRAAPTFWLLVTCILAFGNFYNWFAVDNHKYLMTWWCLAIYCSLLSPEPDRLLAFHGRTLVALCFTFAVAWKIMAPDYLDGSFFRHAILTDGRFATVAIHGAGISRDDYAKNRRAVADLGNPLVDNREAKLAGGPRLNLVAILSTWWTIGIEALLAVAFFLPIRPAFEFARHSLLILFVLTTYLVAPVIPYGWTLLMMGFASCPAGWIRFRAAYVLAYLALQVYGAPIRPT